MDQEENIELSEALRGNPNEENCGKQANEKGETNSSNPLNVSNINSDEIDKETIMKLRGDAIGDTMYSESFLIKTLLYLSDMTWSKKVEEDLCFLWDMTVEKDVCEYLYKLSFPSLACTGLLKYDEPRYVEIVIGILGNVACSENPLTIKSEEIEIILGWLDTDDHLILIQIMRFVKAVSCKSQSLRFITEEIMDKTTFILSNSTNKELLTLTLDVVSKITADSKLEENLVNRTLLESSISAYLGIVRTESEDDVSGECEWEENRQTALKYLVEIVLNVCAYINVSDNDCLLSEAKKCSNKLITEFSKIFLHFSNENSSLPLNENFKFYVEAFTVIFPVLSIPYDGEIFMNLCNIIRILRKNVADISCFIELLQYFISVASIQNLKSDLSRCCSEHDVVQILNLTLQQKTESDFRFKENVNVLLSKYKNSK